VTFSPTAFCCFRSLFLAVAVVLRQRPSYKCLVLNKSTRCVKDARPPVISGPTLLQNAKSISEPGGPKNAFLISFSDSSSIETIIIWPFKLTAARARRISATATRLKPRPSPAPAKTTSKALVLQIHTPTNARTAKHTTETVKQYLSHRLPAAQHHQRITVPDLCFASLGISIAAFGWLWLAPWLAVVLSLVLFGKQPTTRATSEDCSRREILVTNVQWPSVLLDSPS